MLKALSMSRLRASAIGQCLAEATQVPVWPVVWVTVTKGGAVDAAEDFRQYVLGRQRSLLRTAWLLTGDRASAEDLVQTALIRAWPHWSRIAQGDGPDAYVRRVMVNKSIDWRRRRWQGEVPTEQLPEPEVSRTDRELEQVLVDAVRSLPPRQRAVIALRYLDDLSEIETAAVLGCAVGTVKSQTSKALATLRRHPGLHDIELQGSAG
jgi:RNA polymerase sigma-70 factor (sigma-E family)